MPTQAYFAEERRKTAQWAQDLLEGDVVILDFETTGFKDSEIVQIGAINTQGETLMETLVKPLGKIPRGASQVHGIVDSMVVDAPGFRDLYVDMSVLFAGKKIIAFNSDFEEGIIKSECKRHKLPLMRPREWACAMKSYARFYGTWNPKHNSFKWQSLTNACVQQKITVANAHSALGDCLMTLELMKVMAAG
ncbi:MAG: 3'-5' exonuclease [Aggregatilineales bacterium]